MTQTTHTRKGVLGTASARGQDFITITVGKQDPRQVEQQLSAHICNLNWEAELKLGRGSLLEPKASPAMPRLLSFPPEHQLGSKYLNARNNEGHFILQITKHLYYPS